jgi:hypothetical protein
MSDDYGSHTDFVSWVEESAPKRHALVETELRTAFREHIEMRQTEFVLLGRVSATDLALIIREHPTVLKPLLSVCNIAGRALARDIGISNLNTYEPRLDAGQAAAIAGYIKPFLPPAVALCSLSEIDRVEWIDKEIRRIKGHWEDLIIEALARLSGRAFTKRRFSAAGEEFEIDAASPGSGLIEFAVDVKRIEARRDIHKRTDEILNKAARFKETRPSGKFGAVIYYPFVDEHVNVVRRMTSAHVDGIVFAGQSADSINNAVSLLLGQLGLDVV